MVTNPNAFSQQGTGNTLNQIVDGADFPHTGLIKSLSQGIQGNYVISGFDITMGSNTAGTVADGVIMFEGQRKAITLGGSNSFTLTTSSGVNLYHLLVITDSGALALRNQQAGATITADKVADVTSGDTIIAVISSQNGGSSAAQVQYLTTNKKSNSLSIARKNGTTYTEGLTIQSNAGDIEIEAKESDKDIIFKVNDSDGGGAGQEIIRIDGADKRVGIGTNSPDAPLHVETSGSGDSIIIESTDAGATDAPDLVLYRNSASPAVSDEIGSIRFRGKDNAAGDKDYNRITSVIRDIQSASADADLIFQSLSNSVEIEMMKISRIDGIVINEIGANFIDTRIESDNRTHMFFVDSGGNKIGIGNSSPDATLDVEDGGTFRSTRLLTVSISTATTLTEASHAGRYLLCSANITLPATSTEGEHYTILNTTGGNITVGRNGNNINGAGSDATVATFNGVTCIAIGGNDWIALGV
tara:strand:- start:7067 stop:8482 length:1416 start_codon:yes stop_codon:yes gene_type:complete